MNISVAVARASCTVHQTNQDIKIHSQQHMHTHAAGRDASAVSGVSEL